MRTLMLLGSIAMMGTGVFCLANGSAAFMSVAFVIGLAFLLVGLDEVAIGRRTDFQMYSGGVTIAADGAIMAIFGAVLLAGQIADDTTALMLFALWLLIESILSASRKAFEFRQNTANQNVMIVDEIAMFILSMLMFFNSRILSVPAVMLVGAAMFLLGFSRALKSFSIEYSRPGFLTSNEEKLKEAKEDEKKALAKAKEGIREQKDAQRRIAKIEKQISMTGEAIREEVASTEEKYL